MVHQPFYNANNTTQKKGNENRTLIMAEDDNNNVGDYLNLEDADIVSVIKEL
jgi:hypothetical protein